ncbi:hypothetical protein H8959_022692 [Pygathrix nigripes]
MNQMLMNSVLTLPGRGAGVTLASPALARLTNPSHLLHAPRAVWLLGGNLPKRRDPFAMGTHSSVVIFCDRSQAGVSDGDPLQKHPGLGSGGVQQVAAPQLLLENLLSPSVSRGGSDFSPTAEGEPLSRAPAGLCSHSPDQPLDIQDAVEGPHKEGMLPIGLAPRVLLGPREQLMGWPSALLDSLQGLGLASLSSALEAPRGDTALAKRTGPGVQFPGLELGLS